MASEQRVWFMSDIKLAGSRTLVSKGLLAAIPFAHQTNPRNFHAKSLNLNRR